MAEYKHYDAIIGVDPDTEKSGVAEVRIEAKEIRTISMRFPELVGYLRMLLTDGYKVMLVLEASWRRKKLNWHTTKAAPFVNYSVGRNHQTGKLIAEMAEAMGIDVIENEPLTKYWNGAQGKVTQEELTEHIKQYGLTLIEKRTNQDERDAVLMALSQWAFRNMRVK